MTGFYKTYFDILETIEYCIQKDRINPALILNYSALDSFSHLSNRTKNKGREVFKKWVKKWMLEKYPLPCNEIDFYAARCGLLHTQISESHLSNKNEAKEIYYVHGMYPIEPLELAIEISKDKKDKVIAVKIEDLFNSFKQGMSDCFNEMENDIEWKNSFVEKANKYFVLIK